MTHSSKNRGKFAIGEMREFATFPSQTQRYIRRSIDVAFRGEEAVSFWSRDQVEGTAIKAQSRLYERIEDLRKMVPNGYDLTVVEPFMGPLVTISAFDLGQDRLPSFSSYRFLYERLLGASARPWLPGSFCAAAALPHLHPKKRKDLLQSISEAVATAAGWSIHEPTFIPEWVEKVQC